MASCSAREPAARVGTGLQLGNLSRGVASGDGDMYPVSNWLDAGPVVLAAGGHDRDVGPGLRIGC